jgi:hypothetical protein
VTSEPLTSELSLVTQGVRFTHATIPGTTRDGFKCTLPTIKVQGPPDDGLRAALRAAVARRVEMLSGGLKQARARTWADWQAAGKPMAMRSGVDSKTKQPWTAESLPCNVCETCSDPMVRLDSAKMVVLPNQGSMCMLCLMARMQVVMAMTSGEQRRAA